MILHINACGNHRRGENEARGSRAVSPGEGAWYEVLERLSFQLADLLEIEAYVSGEVKTYVRGGCHLSRHEGFQDTQI